MLFQVVGRRIVFININHPIRSEFPLFHMKGTLTYFTNHEHDTFARYINSLRQKRYVVL